MKREIGQSYHRCVQSRDLTLSRRDKSKGKYLQSHKCKDELYDSTYRDGELSMIISEGSTTLQTREEIKETLWISSKSDGYRKIVRVKSL